MKELLSKVHAGLLILLAFASGHGDDARAANGRTKWKMKDGRSLKQLQDAALEREAVSATS